MFTERKIAKIISYKHSEVVTKEIKIYNSYNNVEKAP